MFLGQLAYCAAPSSQGAVTAGCLAQGKGDTVGTLFIDRHRVDSVPLFAPEQPAGRLVWKAVLAHEADSRFLLWGCKLPRSQSSSFPNLLVLSQLHILVKFYLNQ